MITNLQVAARTNNQEAYQRYSQMLNQDSSTRCTLRGLLRFEIDKSSSIALGRGGAGQRDRQALLHRGP